MMLLQHLPAGQMDQWRSQDLVVVAAVKGWDMGRGVPLPRLSPHGEGVWEAGCAPCPIFFGGISGLNMTCFGAFLALF